jgi:dUTP pyrophosphatase
MSILAQADILSLIKKDPPLVEHYLDLDQQIQTNGFDLSLRSISCFTTYGKLSMDNKNRRISEQQVINFEKEGCIHLKQGCYSIVYNEIINLPLDIMALGLTRSSLLRSGASIHTAVWDAGYSGRSESLLVVHNPLGLVMERNARVLQLVFSHLSSISHGYRGAYQGENIT